MRILICIIIAGVFLFAISMRDSAQAHTDHQLHSLQELEDHITEHVQQLGSLLSQRSSRGIQMIEQRQEILKHIQELRDWSNLWLWEWAQRIW